MISNYIKTIKTISKMESHIENNQNCVENESHIENKKHKKLAVKLCRLIKNKYDNIPHDELIEKINKFSAQVGCTEDEKIAILDYANTLNNQSDQNNSDENEYDAMTIGLIIKFCLLASLNILCIVSGLPFIFVY